MAQTVVVRHDAAQASPAALVAALNGAFLDASLTPPRAQAQVRVKGARRSGADRDGSLPGRALHAGPLLASPFSPSAHRAPGRPLQVSARWLPPWHVVAGAALLAASLLHCLAGAAAWLPAWLAHLEWLSLASAALCLPRIAARAALALRQGVSRRPGGQPTAGRCSPGPPPALAPFLVKPCTRPQALPPACAAWLPHRLHPSPCSLSAPPPPLPHPLASWLTCTSWSLWRRRGPLP